MSLVLGVALVGVTVGPSIAGQPPAVKEDMHRQQLERAKKALENALTAVQASGNWNAGGDQHAAARDIESAITEVDKEIGRTSHR
jgi:hypothetical protein